MKSSGGLGRRRFLGALGGSGALGLLAGCPGTGSGPSPTPTPLPTPTGTPTNLPNGIPNATMLQNLALVTQLAKAYRPNAYLVRVESGAVGLSGTLSLGAAWKYIFSFPSAQLEDYWTVLTDGRMQYSANPHILPYDTSTDISGRLLTDSPAAVSAALSHGFSRCIERFPSAQWLFQMHYDSEGGIPHVYLRLLGTDFEVFGVVVLSPQTGSLLTKDVYETCG